MDWKEINISTTYQAYPAVSNFLEELGAAGVCKEELNSRPDEIFIKAYFEDSYGSRELINKLENKISSLQEYNLEVGSGKIELKEVKEEDWANKWKEDFHPVKLTDKIIIKPTWEDYKRNQGETVIEIDPGQAFGTGYHATTEGCVKVIEKYLRPETSFLDIGTGTGILAITAAKLGACPILALDIDPGAVEIARENAVLNQVGNKIEFKQGDLVSNIDKKYDFVAANILPGIILDLIPDLKKVLAQKGRFVLSGIIDEKKRQVNNKLKEYGFKVEESLQDEEWITMTGKIIDN